MQKCFCEKTKRKCLVFYTGIIFKKVQKYWHELLLFLKKNTNYQQKRYIVTLFDTQSFSELRVGDQSEKISRFIELPSRSKI